MRGNDVINLGDKLSEGWLLTPPTKSERMQLLIRPSIKASLKEAAEADGISVNELCNRIFQDYIDAIKEEK